ncbi:MAG: TraR/DksA family transcriptional regulator [Bryobacterales bacterium]|nr:TraR/DksA family transcriptional regulator [Bryobacterales bacterium]
MNNNTYTEKKMAMEQMLRELMGEANAREQLQIETFADALEQIQSAADRDFAVIRLDQKAKLARELRTALHKIEEGTYGVCEECEEAIAVRRLDALPFAKLCVHCQQKAESHVSHRGSETLFEEAA